MTYDKPITIGDLRKELDGLPDDTPIAPLRSQGLSYQDIGKQLGGVSGTRARQLFLRAKTISEIRPMPFEITNDTLLNEFRYRLSRRILNCFRNEGVHTVGDVRALTTKQILSMPNFGKISLDELYAHGIIELS